MKKLRPFLLLGSSLSLFAQSYSKTWEIRSKGAILTMTDELHSQPLSETIKYTLRHILRASGFSDDLGSNAKYEIPVHAVGQTTYSFVNFYRAGGSENFNYTLPYKHCKYDDFEEYDKKLFNHFRFNNNGDYVTVIGLYKNGARIYHTQPGSITIRNQTELLKWEKESFWDGLTRKERQKIQTCPGVKHEWGKGFYIQ